MRGHSAVRTPKRPASRTSRSISSLRRPPDVEALLSAGVVGKRGQDDQRFPGDGYRVVRRPFLEFEGECDTNCCDHHQQRQGSDLHGQTPVQGPPAPRHSLRRCRRRCVRPGRFFWSFFPGNHRNTVRREPGGQQQLVGLIQGQPQHFGTPHHVIPVTGAAGHPFLPADKGQPTDLDPAGQFRIADARPDHVFGQ